MSDGTIPGHAAAAPPEREFRRRILDSRELSVAVKESISKSARLTDADQMLIAKMYDKFRSKLAPALESQDFNNLDHFFWIEFIGDMMLLAKTFKVSGPKKKEILMATLDLVVENEVPPEERDSVNRLIVLTVSPAIDLAIYFFDHIKPKCRSLFAKCRCCC